MDWNPDSVELIAKMQSDNPKDRPSLDLIIENLNKAAHLEAEIDKLIPSANLQDIMELVNNNSPHLTLEMVLQYAIKYKHVEIAKTIILWQAEDAHQTIDLKKILLYCISNDRWNTEIIQALIKNLDLKYLNKLLKVDIGQGSAKQRTLLNLAINNDDACIVKELLHKKVSLSANNIEFSTALDRFNPHVIQEFISVLDKNALSTTKDNNGKTALMIAVKAEDPKIVRALIAAGVNLNEQDKHGNTALRYASNLSNKEITLLLEAQIEAQKGKPLLSFLLEKPKQNLNGNIQSRGLTDKKFIEILPKIIDKIVENKLYGSSLELAIFIRLNRASDASKQICSNLMFKFLENGQYEHANILAQSKGINVNTEDGYGNTALSLMLERLTAYKIKTPPKLELQLTEKLISLVDFSKIKQKEKFEEIVMAERKYYFRRSNAVRKLFYKLEEQLEGPKPIIFSKKSHEKSLEAVSVHLPKQVEGPQKPSSKR